MNFERKLVPLPELADRREQWRRAGRKVVATNGCFDLLHLGHVTYLSEAKEQGDFLLVGVNSDDAVRLLKGASRPINGERDRALVLAALESVDAVCIFPDKRATEFLTVARPDVYVKGGDYRLESLDPGERAAVESAGGKIVLIPFVPGKSTTGVIERLGGGKS